MSDMLVVAALVVLMGVAFYTMGRLLGLFPPIRNRWLLLAMPLVMIVSLWVLLVCL